MSNSIQCGECLVSFRFQQKHAGKLVRCPGCSKPVRLPAWDDPTDAAESHDVDSQDEEFQDEQQNKSDWSWDNSDEESSWSDKAGAEDDRFDQEVSLPLPPRMGQKRGMRSAGTRTDEPKKNAESGGGLRSTGQRAGVFSGALIASLVLTLAVGKLLTGPRNADQSPIVSERDAAAPEIASVENSSSQTEDSAGDVSDSRSNVKTDVVASNAGTINSPLWTLPYYLGNGGILESSGELVGVSEGKIVRIGPTFFDGDMKAAGTPVEIPGIKVASLMERRIEERTILLTTDESSTIHMLNAETLEVQRTIPVFQRPAGQSEVTRQAPTAASGTWITIVSSRSPDDPFVFVRRRKEVQPGDVQAVNLKTFEVLDGAEVVERMKGLTESMLGNWPLEKIPMGRMPIWLDIYGRFVARPNSLRDLTEYPASDEQNFDEAFMTHGSEPVVLDQNVALDFQPLGTADQGRWLIGIKASKEPSRMEGLETKANPVYLCFASPDNFRTVAEFELPNAVVVPLPTPAQQAQGADNSRAGQTTWQDPVFSLSVSAMDDPKGRRVILMNGNTVMAVPYDLPGLPSHPVLAIQNRRTAVHVNETLAFDLQPVEAQTTVELVNAPESMTVDGSVLKWTPTQDDVGRHRIRLRLKKDGRERELIATIDVANKSLPWRSVYSGILAISQDGKRAMTAANDPNGNHPSEYTLFDLTERRVLARKAIPKLVTSLDVGKEHFVATRKDRQTNSTDMIIGKTATLEIEKTLEGFSLGGDPVQIVGDRYVVPASPHGHPTVRMTTYWIDLDDLNSVRGTASEPNGFPSTRTLFMETRNGTLADGLFRVSEDEQARGLFGISALFSASPFAPFDDRRFDPNNRRKAASPAPTFVPRMPIRDALFSHADLASDICYRAQVRLKLVPYAPNDSGREADQVVYLIAIDLRTREIVKRWMVSRQRYSNYNPEITPIVRGDQVWVLNGGRIIEISLAELPDQSPPLEVGLCVKPFMVSGRKDETTVRYSIVGGKEPYSTSLYFEDFKNGSIENEQVQDFVRPGKTPGEFRVDGKALLKRLLTGKLWYYNAQFNVLKDTDVPWIETYRQRASDYLTSNLGVETKDVPICTTLRFKVADSTGDTVELVHQIVVEVPVDQLDDALRRNLERYEPLHNKK